jgi:adenylate cyclase class 2
MPNEIEIKFRIENLSALTRALKQAGFKQITRSTHEMNSLYDLPGQKLRKRDELLRLRKYGEAWLLTHKAKGDTGATKRGRAGNARGERPADGRHSARPGFTPTFRYEKYRAEWSDGTGHVVLDKLRLEISARSKGRHAGSTAPRARSESLRDYITETYAPMFFAWKRRTCSKATEMTFRALGKKPGVWVAKSS